MRSIVAFLLAVWVVAVAAAEEAKPPNIIVVMSDDHGQWAMKTYGLDEVATPNLDWLAREGVLFENAMSPAPVCSPARASFYTGKMPSQHGVHDFLSENESYDGGWLRGETLLSERLQDAGYRTALLGKWHGTTDSLPPQPGFDRWLSYDALSAGWQNQYVHSGTVRFSSDGKPVEFTGVQARFLTEEAIRFVDQGSDKPFFISLNLVEPHWPFEGLPERLVSQYRRVAADIIPPGDYSAMADRGSATTTPMDHPEQLAQYLAAVSLIDEQVGRVLDALQGRDLLQDTIVIYTSDHGLLMGQYGLYGKVNATNPGNFYEEVIRIPMIIRGPDGHVRRQQARHEFVDLIDLHATILDFATNGKMSASYGPGRTMRPLLRGDRNTDWRVLQFAERGNSRMVTNGRWKLTRHYHRSSEQPPSDVWHDLAHPQGERQPALGPSMALQRHLADELDKFFGRYETEEHSGRNIWDQPPPNARMCADLGLRCPE